MNPEVALNRFGEPLAPESPARLRVIVLPGGRYGLLFDRVDLPSDMDFGELKPGSAEFLIAFPEEIEFDGAVVA